MSKAMRQMPERSGRVCVAQGEAVRDHISDEACGPLPEHPDTGSAKSMAGTGGLLAAALTRENLQAAFRRVKANKGATGGDSISSKPPSCCARAGRASAKRCWQDGTGPIRYAR